MGSTESASSSKATECVFIDSQACVRQVWIQPWCGCGCVGVLCWRRQGARVGPLQHVGAVEKIQ